MAERKKKKLTMEQSFARLDEITAKMEEPGVTLEDSFSLYKEGMELVKSAQEMLDGVEKEMRILGEDDAQEPAESEIEEEVPWDEELPWGVGGDEDPEGSIFGD